MSITLRDLVARGTPLEWFEGVAIVQELAATVAQAAGTGEPRVPDLGGAEVAPDGQVRVIDAGDADQAPVFRLAHVLNALLAGDAPPVPLRLIVLTALAPESTYKTLLELTQALEYFERPDRRSVVAAVYDRAQALPVIESNVPPLPNRPTEAAGTAAKREKTPWTRRRRILFTIGAPACIVLAVVGWWASRPAGARVLSSATATLSRTVASTVRALRTGLAGSAAAPSEPPASAAAAAPPRRPARHHSPRPIPARRSLAEGGLSPVVALAPSVDREAWIGPPERVDEVIWLNVPAEVATPTAAVYSAADRDVKPPVSVRPRLPSEPPPGVPLEALTRLEVLVTAAGEVESVKIVAGPRTALDGMMLSAVKAWRFQPATRDGGPVAYRQLVWLTTR
jgi:TonB family protein